MRIRGLCSGQTGYDRLTLPAWCGFLGVLLSVLACPISVAQQAAEIDQLTKRWLQLERQSSKLQLHWLEQKRLLEQRLRLLEAQKQQLQSVVLERQGHNSQVEDRRAELLAQQEQFEAQHAGVQQALSQLVSKTQTLTQFLPPPLQIPWQKESQALRDSNDGSTTLQVTLAKLSLLADFNRRVSVHSSPIAAPDGQTVVVKQLYLGLGMAWFVTENGQLAGWGQAGEDHWVWHFDSQLKGQSVLDAIAMYEKRKTADWVQLPFHVPQNLASGTSEVNL